MTCALWGVLCRDRTKEGPTSRVIVTDRPADDRTMANQRSMARQKEGVATAGQSFSGMDFLW